MNPTCNKYVLINLHPHEPDMPHVPYNSTILLNPKKFVNGLNQGETITIRNYEKGG